MMVGLFGQYRDPRHEAERGDEIVEAEFPADPFRPRLQCPSGQRAKRRFPVRIAQPLDHLSSPFAFAYGPAMDRFAPTAQEIETLALQALARLPDPFRAHLAGVVLFIEDFATDDILAEMGIDDPFGLTGLYSGRPVGQEATTGDLPPTVHLFRRPLLDEWVETGVALDALITHVVVHEIGHHFGLSDADMHALEDMATP